MSSSRRAFEFYVERRNETYSPLLNDFFFKKFREFIRRRTEN